MHRLAWFARIAFIGNIFFMGCLLLQFRANEKESYLISMVAILGLVLGMGIFNPLSNVLNGIALLRRRQLFAQVPAWLAGANLFFLICQLVYIIHTWS